MKAFICGHQADIPANMGRGEARAKRVSAYFSRKCFACRVVAVKADYANPNFHPLYTLEEKIARLAKEYK